MKLTKDQIEMIEQPLQDLEHIKDPLEAIKVTSALQSECLKIDYRKKYKPEDISPLDYTIIAALMKQIPTKPKTDENKRYCCPDCGYIVAYESGYGTLYSFHCENCGQKIYWGKEETEGAEDGEN